MRLTPIERYFNKVHSGSRQCVERCIGICKGRFRRLKFIDIQGDEDICYFIGSVGVLHNLVLKTDADDTLEEYYEDGRQEFSDSEDSSDSDEDLPIPRETAKDNHNAIAQELYRNRHN